MKNFSAESLIKYRFLNFLLPIIGHVMSRGKRLLTFIDAHAGPGSFIDDEGFHSGSPMIFYNVASLLQIATRLVLIEKDPRVFDQLFHLAMSLPHDSDNQILPIPGDCDDHVGRVVAEAGKEPVFIISDPRGCEIPAFLAEVANRKNVTLLMRFSAVGAWRSKQGKAMLAKFKKVDKPHWRFGAEDPNGLHKYRMLLATHDRQVAEACEACLEPISGPSDQRIFA